MKELRLQRRDPAFTLRLKHSAGREIGLRCHGRFAVWFKQCPITSKRGVRQLVNNWRKH